MERRLEIPESFQIHAFALERRSTTRQTDSLRRDNSTYIYAYNIMQDDGTNRMIIADRYNTQARLRRLVRWVHELGRHAHSLARSLTRSLARSLVSRILSRVQLAYVVLRTFWNMIPVVMGHDPLSWVDVGILAFGAALHPLHGYAFGRTEKTWAIRAYGVMSVLLLGECFVRFWLYHVQFGPNALEEEVAAIYPRIPKSIAIGISDAYIRMLVFRACDVFEKVYEVVGLMACTSLVYFVNEYLSSRRDAEAEAKAKRT